MYYYTISIRCIIVYMIMCSYQLSHSVADSVLLPDVYTLHHGVVLLFIMVLCYLQVAERLYVKGGHIKDAIDMYTLCGRWEDAHKVSDHRRRSQCPMIEYHLDHIIMTLVSSNTLSSNKPILFCIYYFY